MAKASFSPLAVGRGEGVAVRVGVGGSVAVWVGGMDVGITVGAT